ncbi:hypothetical protein Pmani_018371 [Petrolisthes manimaculis]|uniref:CRAL-TRIO domain-containing protein n=1 Tax=Petrolisthes manimaculis TaxID=1843537 RepID=A0AAE1U8U5_9EUCA|nr:hypothetical protein Pmani_018371 [Petrolisthes manimaculis]
MSELQELKERVAAVSNNIHHLKIDDKLLKRYLIAFRSVSEAYKRILETDRWRGEFGAAKLTIETPGVKRIHNTRICTILEERDRKGRPVVVVTVRNHSFQNRNMDDMTNYIVYSLDSLCARCQKDGLDNTCIVFDMRDFSLTCMDYPAIRKLFQIMSDHYPERLGTCLIVNSPYLFNACWMIIRTWIDENTASKIKFVKTEELSPYIDRDILPKDL